MSRSKSAISTIAYNGEVLTARLNELLQEGTISFWAYVFRNGIPSEYTQGKDFYMVYVKPKVLVNAEAFKDRFNADDGRPTTMNWRKSKFYHWYKFAIQDAEYLKEKGMLPKGTYSPEDVKSSDPAKIPELLSETK